MNDDVIAKLEQTAKTFEDQNAELNNRIRELTRESDNREQYIVLMHQAFAEREQEIGQLKARLSRRETNQPAALLPSIGGGADLVLLPQPSCQPRVTEDRESQRPDGVQGGLAALQRDHRLVPDDTDQGKRETKDGHQELGPELLETCGSRSIEGSRTPKQDQSQKRGCIFCQSLSDVEEKHLRKMRKLRDELAQSIAGTKRLEQDKQALQMLLVEQQNNRPLAKGDAQTTGVAHLRRDNNQLKEELDQQAVTNHQLVTALHALSDQASEQAIALDMLWEQSGAVTNLLQGLL